MKFISNNAGICIELFGMVCFMVAIVIVGNLLNGEPVSVSDCRLIQDSDRQQRDIKQKE